MTDDERWVPVPGYEGVYEVSDLGQVRSISRYVKGKMGPRFAKGRVLRPSPNSNGYRSIVLCDGRTQKTRTICTIVLAAFVGPSNGLDVSHENGNCQDDRLRNLKYRTRKSNNALKFVHGTMPIGSKHSRAKITEDDAREILRSDKTHRALSIIYGVSESAIYYIKAGRNWRHVSQLG